MRPTIKLNFRRDLPVCASLILFCALGISTRAGAQVETTTGISGSVIDPTGAVIPGATVVIRNQDTGASREITTGADGSYAFPSLQPGVYMVTVKKEGFKTAVVTNRVVQVTQPAHVDITLELGQATQTVTVSAEGAELISTSTAEVAGTVQQTLVRRLPLISRNFFDLAVLTPGTSPQYLDQGNPVSFTSFGLNFVTAGGEFASSSVFAGGNRDSAANVSIDGSNVQIPVYEQSTQLQSPADVQEVKVESANMNAEFGNGAAAVNVITKSGTNLFHGEAYEYLRNNHLDSAPFFTNLTGQKLPNFQHNQFGGAVGGPIKKNKLFFFTNYEGSRIRQGTTAFETVPPSPLFAGDFSNFRRLLPNGTFGAVPTLYNPYRFDPVTGLREPFPGNRIPLGPTDLCKPRPTCADPVTVTYLQRFVRMPNTEINGIPMLTGTAKTDIDSNQYTLRLDFLKSPSSTIYGRYTSDKRDSLAGGIQPLEGTQNPTSAKNLVVHYTRTIKGRMANDFSASYTRPKWFLGRNTNVPDVSALIGLPNTLAGPGGPSFSGPEFSLGNSGLFLLRGTSNTIQVKDDLSYSTGKHSYKLGLEGTEKRFFYPIQSFDKGLLLFQAGGWTSACPEGNAACAAARKAKGLDPGGLAFADFLIGAANQSRLERVAAPYEAHQRYYGVYAQDSWRVTHRLTLNYGLRYEYWSPWLVPRNTVNSFNFQTQNIQYALQNPLDFLDPSKGFGRNAPRVPSEPRQGYRVGNKDFAPRIGLAYLLTPETTVRASFGVFYDGNANNNQFHDIQSGGAPFNLRDQEFAVASDPIPPLLVGNLFPRAAPTSVPQPNSNPPANFRFVMPFYPTPAVYQWSLSLQRRLSSAWGVEADYVGSHTIHEFMFIDENAAALPQGPLAGLSLQQRRQFPQWGTLGTWAPIGWGKYNALIVSVKNNGWHGLTLQSNFSWIKNLITSNVIASDQGNTDFRAPYIWAGRANITPERRFIAGYSYDLPLGRGKAFGSKVNSPFDKLISGWSVSGITEFSTGSPLAVRGRDRTGTGSQGIELPDRICDPNHGAGSGTRFAWFRTSCFVPQPFGRKGNSSLGSVIAPGINTWNLSIAKSTPTNFPKESGRVEFQANFFNAFNHTQWADPDTFLDSRTFGQIFSTRPARQLQFSLKYLF